MNIQYSIPQLKGLLSIPGRHGLGQIGEYVASLLLKASGYDISHNHCDQRGDLIAWHPSGKTYRVEVKTARKSSDGAWRFCLWKKGKTDYRHSDFIVLLAVTKSGDCIPFVIPTSDIKKKITVIAITSNPRTYGGKWSIYRQSLHEGLQLCRIN